MKVKRCITFGLFCCILCSLALQTIIWASEDTVYHWYCKRNSSHQQPIMDAELRWIEKYQGYYLDHSHTDTSEEKVLYLTFDAGYENGNIEKILNVLQEENVTGAFFILGHLIQSTPSLVQRMKNEGHTVANHTNTHRNMTSLDNFEAFERELKDLETLYSEHIGGTMSPYYRPPEGTFDERSLRYAEQLGYKTIFWSFAYEDWDNQKQPSPQAAKAKILDHLHNGAVILLHPTSKTNALILQDVIRECKAQGYRFGTLDELTASGDQATS